jgi:hypothetical protein
MSQRNYDVTERPIASIRPYERNPRDNSKAVEKVGEGGAIPTRALRIDVGAPDA